MNENVNFASIPEWYQYNDCQVLLPDERLPRGIVHFIGGFLAGATSIVQISYSSMLEYLRFRGYIIVVTPIPVLDLDHESISKNMLQDFSDCCENFLENEVGLKSELEQNRIPFIGIGHSLGGKLQLLAASKLPKQTQNIQNIRRNSLAQFESLKYSSKDANIFIAFNNYGLSESIEIGKDEALKVAPELSKVLDALNNPAFSRVRDLAQDKLVDNDVMSDVFDAVKSFGMGYLQESDIDMNFAESMKFTSAEFSPSPDETWDILRYRYMVEENYVIKFNDDAIDQSLDLMMQLQCINRPRIMVNGKLYKFPGNHITPNQSFQDRNAKKLFREVATILDQICSDIEGTSRKRQQRILKLPDNTQNWDTDET